MKIAVNTRLLLHNKLEGIGWFTFETLKRITKNHPEHEFYFLFDRTPHPSFVFKKNVTPIVIHPQARHPLLYIIWFEWSVKRALKKLNIDLFLSPDGYLSLSSDVKSLAVIHDLNFEHHPEYLSFINRLYYRFFFPKFAAKAKRIATVSNFSKQDLVNTYGCSPEKIEVVNNGANPVYQPVSEEIKTITKNKWSKGRDYFLYVGSLHKRKNISGLLQAFERFANYDNQINLVIVGKKMFSDPEMESIYAQMKHQKRVTFTNRLSTSDLHHVLASAKALVYVPFFEGFGIPVIEAMQCGTPVITSNCTSIPEVAGNAAILVNPNHVDEICEAMTQISSNKTLCNKLSMDGFDNAKRFSWDITATKMWDCIKNTMNE